MTPAHDSVVRHRLAKLRQPEQTTVLFGDFWMSSERYRQTQVDAYAERFRNYPAHATLAVLDELAPTGILPPWAVIAGMLSERIKPDEAPIVRRRQERMTMKAIRDAVAEESEPLPSRAHEARQ